MCVRSMICTNPHFTHQYHFSILASETLLSFHRLFLEQLKTAECRPEQLVGAIVVSCVNQMKMYCEFVRNYKRSMLVSEHVTHLFDALSLSCFLLSPPLLSLSLYFTLPPSFFSLSLSLSLSLFSLTVLLSHTHQLVTHSVDLSLSLSCFLLSPPPLLSLSLSLYFTLPPSFFSLSLSLSLSLLSLSFSHTLIS